MRLAIDTGGTFTDLVIEDDSQNLHMFKAPTTPNDPVDGILETVKMAADSMSTTVEALLNRAEILIHGTTHAINAVITGNTAKTAFLTTKGHPDILVFREGGRIEPFNFNVPFPKPYIPRALTFEVAGRISSDGKVIEALDERALIETINRLKELAVEAVAVCLLWSTVNTVHEDRVGELLNEHMPGIPYTLSHVLNPILREYRRASSTAIDASLKLTMSGYLERLMDRLTDSGFRGRLLMLTSKGGVMDVKELASAPIHAIGSGPSMAPIAGKYYAQLDADADTAIVADTGGTTYDVSLVRRGIIPTTKEAWIGQRTLGQIVGFPSVDVKSVGAGGGSIAWVDEGSLIHVGPISAGAVPGPACYNRGGARPTVTDASLVLGYIDPNFFLGGKMSLNVDLAKKAIEREISLPLKMDMMKAASAIMMVVTENMVKAIEQITINQGMDPRDAVLIGAGGAAGLNSVAIAKKLGCKKLIIPEVGAALSAQGALISDLHSDYRALFYTEENDFDFDGVNATLESLIGKCRAFIDGPGAGSIESSIDLFTEARYQAQVWEIDVPLRNSRFKGNEDIYLLRQDFDQVHEELFAFRDPGSEVEFVGWGATARCKLSKYEFGQLVSNRSLKNKDLARHKAYFSGIGEVETPVELFNEMKVDVSLDGPAIVHSPFTTVVIYPGGTAVRKESGSLVISLS